MSENLQEGLDTSPSITNQNTFPIFAASVVDSPDLGTDSYASPLTVVSAIIPANGTAQASASGSAGGSLLGLRTTDLFPVFNQIVADSQNIAASQAELEGIQQSLRFYQSLLIFPGSATGLRFIKLLQSYQSDPLNVESAINAFFAGTTDYKQATLAGYVAASTYARTYAFAWANFANEFTYGVFQPADAPDAKELLVNIGSISFRKRADAPVPADVADRNGGYDISYTPLTDASVKLSLAGGYLADADNTVSLALGYGLKSEFTGQDQDSNTPWPLLVGQIKGVRVKAVGKPETAPALLGGDPSLQGWVKLFSPKTVEQWLTVVGLMTGLAVALGLLVYSVYKLVKAIKAYQATTGQLPKPGEIQVLESSYQNALEALGLTENDILRGMGVPTGEDGKEADEALDIGKDKIQYRVDYQKTIFDSVATEQLNSLKILGKYSVNANIKEGIYRISKVKELLSKVTDAQTLVENRPDIASEIDLLKTNVEAAIKAAGNAVDQEEKTYLENVQNTVDGLKQVADATQEELEEFLEE